MSELWRNEFSAFDLSENKNEYKFEMLGYDALNAQYNLQLLKKTGTGFDIVLQNIIKAKVDVEQRSIIFVNGRTHGSSEGQVSYRTLLMYRETLQIVVQKLKSIVEIVTKPPHIQDTAGLFNGLRYPENHAFKTKPSTLGGVVTRKS